MNNFLLNVFIISLIALGLLQPTPSVAEELRIQIVCTGFIPPSFGFFGEAVIDGDRLECGWGAGERVDRDVFMVYDSVNVSLSLKNEFGGFQCNSPHVFVLDPDNLPVHESLDCDGPVNVRFSALP